MLKKNIIKSSLVAGASNHNQVMELIILCFPSCCNTRKLEETFVSVSLALRLAGALKTGNIHAS